ncbi:MAG TPA: MerR family transcriptional regulator [Aggregatilineales bacterium]|nr:MerR family transcriptional regulator [Aggregatilineales bacterium]
MFRIGEFSKIAQVSGRLLRYYDEIGLLSPGFTDPQTGYRYYSATQLPRLNRILVLKELGLSLEQITDLLAQDLPTEAFRGMLALRKAQIEQSLQEESARLRMVESRLDQLNAFGQVQEPDVVFKSVEAQPFLALREVLPDMPSVKRLVQIISNTVPVSVGPQLLGAITIVIHTPIYDPAEYDLEIGYVTTGKVADCVQLPNDRVLTLRELPAVATMATFVHLGPVETSHRSYGLLAVALEKADYQIAGLGREVIMQLPTLGPDADAVIELQIPVIKREQNLRA